MAMNATLLLQIAVKDAQNREVSPVGPIRQGWSPAVLETKEVSLTASAHTTLVVPAGAKLCVLELGAAFNLVLKGNSADTGTKLAATANPLGLPCVIPLGTSATLVIQNLEASAQVIRVSFL